MGALMRATGSSQLDSTLGKLCPPSHACASSCRLLWVGLHAATGLMVLAHGMTRPAPHCCRRALVLLRSVEGTYWAGSYGTKFASAELRFLRRCEVRGFGARESQAFWRSRRADAPDVENDAEAENEAVGSDSDSDDDSEADGSDEDDEDDGSEHEE